MASAEARSLTDGDLSELEFVINGDNLEVRRIAKDGEPEERVGGLVTSVALTLITNMIR